MKIEITNWLTGKVFLSVEACSLRLALEAAVWRVADLGGADLRDTDLRNAELTTIRDDLWAVLSAAPAEVEGLRAALVAGKIDGSTYMGECACLLGTIAKVRGCQYTMVPLLTPDEDRPSERFFTTIKPDDTPAISQAAALAVEWIDQWMANVRGAFAGTGADT